MKKIGVPLAIVVIWAVIFVLGPIIAGGKVEDRLHSVVTQVNSNGPVRLNIDQFDRGVFSSRVNLTLSINPAALGPAAKQLKGQTLALKLQGKIEHGPFLFDHGFAFAAGGGELKLVLDANTRAKMTQMFGTEVPLSLNTNISWGGAVNLSGNVPALNSTDGNVHAKPVQFTVNLSGDDQRLTSSVKWGGLTVAETGKDNSTGFKLTVSPVSVHSDVEQAIPELWVGDAKMSFGGATFAKGAAVSGSISKMLLTSHTEMDAAKKYLSGTMTWTLGSAEFNHRKWVKNVDLAISMDHWYGPSLQKLRQAVRDAQKAGNTPQSMQVAVTMQLMGTLPDMIKRGLSLNINRLNLVLLGYPVTSSLKLRAKQGTDVSRGMAALATVEASAKLTVPRALLNRFPQFISADTINGLVQQGMVKEEKGILKVQAEFKGGKLTVNGKPIPIPGMVAAAH